MFAVYLYLKRRILASEYCELFVAVWRILAYIEHMNSGRLGKLTSVFTGYQSRNTVETSDSGSHWLLQIRDFDESRRTVDWTSATSFLPELSESDTELREGDVVFLARGHRNFAWAVHDLPGPTLATAYFFVLRPHDGLTGNYLAWYLNQQPALRHIRRLGTSGAHMPIVRRADLESLEVPVPDLATQHRVAAFSELAEKQQRLLFELAELKQLQATSACLQAVTLDQKENP